ncbi:putative glycine--tRNA ligase [Rosa chinensis]|uniref:glycine--tRNA ligase n=1 Tax=Rosa chinensis TaxID=74649 RepID=A0A2P6R028_ROSCH|nr:putative glycine--tRNA ligase [Rosa chinensis]
MSDDTESSRRALGNTLERRFFYIPSFKIYGAVAGLYDYGSPGCKLKKNVLSLWHQDKKKGTCYRADHLLKDFCNKKLEEDRHISSEMAMELKEVLSKLDGLSAEELGACIKKYGITAPETDNHPLSDPYPFNLMFQTSIGPSGSSTGFFRPETAQGIFVNFMDIYYDNGCKLPCAVAQVGQAFRNEISPRQGLLRVREFTLAEIEHFVDPKDKSHLKFPSVEKLELLMFPRDEQKPGQSARLIKVGEAVHSKVYLFLTRLGIDKNRLRFRQHLAKEMAHYAADCWDAEIETSYGWIECVVIADRSAYDLKAHSGKSRFEAHEQLSEPRDVEILVISPVKKQLGPAFGKKQKNVLEALEAMNEEEISKMKAELDSKGEVDFFVCTLGEHVSIKSSMVTISKVKAREHQRKFTPSVIEPSFGIGRIIYRLFEHSFYPRPDKTGDEQLNVFRFNPLVAPFKCTVFPLVRNQQFEAVAKDISKSLTAAGISHKMDTTGTSIGKRYARTDELGVPFAIMVDSTS